MKTAFLLFFFIVMLFSIKANAQQSFNSLNVKELAVSGSVNVSSTTKSSKPCPSMTEAERDLVATPATGSCIYNSDTLTLNVYNGAAWKSAGGGVNQWITGASYQVDDVIIESSKFYVCLIAHTSGTFATDLASLNWEEVSEGLTGVIPLANGGTAKSITASNGAIAYSDTDSLELLAPGTSGQVLQTNGAAAPTFVNKSISAKSENGSSVTLEEIQAPNNQLTTTATNKHLLNDCGSSNNLFANCGFEHSTPATGWTLTNGSSAVETSNVKQGKQSLKLTLSAQDLDFYQTSTLNVTALADGVNGSISLAIKTIVDNIYLCRTDSAGAVVASTDGTKITNCIKVPNSGKWSDLLLPVILGATSNGLRLVSLTPSTAAAVAITGDVYVDSGILEAGLKAPSQGVCTDVSCETEFSAKVSSAGVVSGENMDWINGNCAVTATSTYTCTYNSGVATVNMNCSATGDNYQISLGTQTASTFQYVTTNSGTTATAAGAQIVCQKQGVDFTNAKALASGRFYTVPSDSFSTDLNTLTWSASAITASSPVGTYNTYSYAINSNTKSLCTGTSDPDILPNAADGFKIFTRAYNAASTCGNPARVEIKIGAAGTKFPTIKTDIYKSAAKVTAGSLDFSVQSSTVQTGARATSYDEATGVLIVDSGYADLATITSSSFFFNDVSGQASGYLVINAQKAKDSIIGSFAEVNTSPGIAKPKTCHYAFGGASATLAIPVVCSTGTCVEAYDSCGAVAPPAYSSTGVYLNLTISNGTFANSSYIECECKSYDAATGNPNDCNLYWETGDQSWATNSSGGFVANVFTPRPAGTATNSYVQINCKGNAP